MDLNRSLITLEIKTRPQTLPYLYVLVNKFPHMQQILSWQTHQIHFPSMHVGQGKRWVLFLAALIFGLQ